MENNQFGRLTVALGVVSGSIGTVFIVLLILTDVAGHIALNRWLITLLGTLPEVFSQVIFVCAPVVLANSLRGSSEKEISGVAMSRPTKRTQLVLLSGAWLWFGGSLIPILAAIVGNNTLQNVLITRRFTTSPLLPMVIFLGGLFMYTWPKRYGIGIAQPLTSALESIYSPFDRVSRRSYAISVRSVTGVIGGIVGTVASLGMYNLFKARKASQYQGSFSVPVGLDFVHLQEVFLLGMSLVVFSMFARTDNDGAYRTVGLTPVQRTLILSGSFTGIVGSSVIVALLFGNVHSGVGFQLFGWLSGISPTVILGGLSWFFFEQCVTRLRS